MEQSNNQTMNTCRMAIADDEALFRKGLGMLIEDFENMEVVLEAADGQDLIDQLEDLESREKILPDVLLLDLNMPKLNGIEVAKRLQQYYPSIRIIVLSSHFSKAFIINMVEIGAASYLPKNTEPTIMEETIKEVMKNNFHYTKEIMSVIRENMIRKKKVKASFSKNLTNREVEILQLICEQYTAAEIAKKLYISRRTVEGHRNNLLAKLNCRNIAGLVVYAVQNELVKINPTQFWKS